MTRLLLLGDYSGRNTGHNAHLLSACQELRQAVTNCEILVPTLSPRPIQSLCKPFSDIKPFGVAPWHGCIKFFGPAMLAALKRSQALVLADNMFYDNHLFHPLKNNLMALLWLVKAARRRGLPVIYFNAGVGPARYRLGRWIIRRLAPQMDLVLLRDQESADLFKQLTGSGAGKVTADSGFNMPWQALGAKTQGAPADDGLIGINLSGHLHHWISSNTDKQALQGIAACFEALAGKTGGRLVFIVAHAADLAITEKLCAHLKPAAFEIWQEDGALVERIAGNIDRFACLLGIRYHEIVLFASYGVPVLGLDCGEKLDGLFDTLQCRENLLTTGSLSHGGGRDYLVNAVEHAMAQAPDCKNRVRQLASNGLAGGVEVQRLIAG